MQTVALVSFLLAQTAMGAPTVLSPVRVVDVRAAAVVAERAVVVDGGRIAAITEASASFPADAVRVDGGNAFLIPGLIDSHVHLNEPDRDVPLMIAYGVVGVRDMGGETGERVELRERARRGELRGLRLLITGTLLDGKPAYHAWSESCDTPDEGRRAAQLVADAGVDQVKVYSRLKPEVHAAIVDEAKNSGLRVVGHVPDSMTVLDAARTGQATNEHLQRAESLFMDLMGDFKPEAGEGFTFGGGLWAGYSKVDGAALDARLRELAATGMVQCPTLVLSAGYGRVPPGDETLAAWRRFLPPGDVQAWTSKPQQWAGYVDSAAAAWPGMLDLVGRMHRAGNTILVGTDLANPYALAGYSVHEEMKYLKQAGLSDAACLRAATLSPAEFLGVASELGTIEAGKAASFVMLDANPLKDIANARRIREVWVNGRRHDATAIEQMKSDAELVTQSMIPTEVPELGPLAGEQLASLTYVLKYQDWEIGTEDLTVTRTPSGFLVRVVNRLATFGRVPMMVESRHDSSGRFAGAEWRVFGKVESTGAVEANGKLDFTRGEFRAGAPLGVRAEDLLIPPLSMGTEMMLLRGLDLAVDGTHEVQGYALQARNERVSPSKWKITRRADENVKTASGVEVGCRKFVFERVDVRGGPRIGLWVDAEGVPVRRVRMQGSLAESVLRK